MMVFYALPGELVQVATKGRRGGLTYANAVHVMESSEDRVPARCPHFGECGGCQWQHARYEAQLEFKRKVVEDAWRKAGVRLPPDSPVLGMADPWGYRIRGEFEAIEDRQGRVSLGFHRMRSHAVLPVTTCPIHDERIERAALALGRAATELQVGGLVNVLLTVEPTGSGLLWRTRYERRSQASQDQALAARAAELLADLVLLDDSISLEFWDLTFRARSDTFVQTNYRQMLVLYEVALGMLGAGSGDAVLDLYAGIGTISVAAARAAGSVTAIEENPAAVRLARLNARINGTDNLRVLPGTVQEALRQVRLGDHQAVILDPPRAGCETAAIAELLRLGTERLVYVSCEPSTQARDVALLVRGGYRVRRAAVVDMFPHTYHVETVALLERTGG
jgi:23S rRNA (uracil1939-C5)-methyltransferase